MSYIPFNVRFILNKLLFRSVSYSFDILNMAPLMFAFDITFSTYDPLMVSTVLKYGLSRVKVTTHSSIHS